MEEKRGRTIDAKRQHDYRRMVQRLGDRRTSRHCFIFYSVRAGGSRGNSLPNVNPGKQNQDIKEIKPVKEMEIVNSEKRQC